MSRTSQPIELAIAPLAPDVQDSNAIPFWIGLAMALVVLVVAVLESRRHLSEADDRDPTSRFARIAISAALLSCSLTLLFVADTIAGPGEWSDFVPLTLFAALLLMLIFLFIVTLVDLCLGLFAPSRSGIWLGLAVGSFVLLVVAVFGFALWLSGVPEELLHPEMLPLVFVAAAAGITWWSRLPPPAAQVERRFE